MGLGPCCKTALFSPSFFRSVVILVGDPFWWFWKIKKRPVGEGHCVLRGASALFIYYTGWLSSCGCLESLYVVDGTEDWIIFTSRNRVGGLGGKSGPVRQQSKVDRPPALRYGATVYLEPPPRADGGLALGGFRGVAASFATPEVGKRGTQLPSSMALGNRLKPKVLPDFRPVNADQ